MHLWGTIKCICVNLLIDGICYPQVNQKICSVGHTWLHLKAHNSATVTYTVSKQYSLGVSGQGYRLRISDDLHCKSDSLEQTNFSAHKSKEVCVFCKTLVLVAQHLI